MEELQDQLIQELGLIIDHLKKYEELTWASHFTRARDLVDHGDIRGVEFLTNMRGGMGSFLDLGICRENGHKIEKGEEDFANTELMRLGEQAFFTADKLKREVNRSTSR